MALESVRLRVVDLKITDVLGAIYYFKEADIVKHRDSSEGIFVRGRGADEGLRFEIAYDKLVSIQYKLGQKEVENEQNA